MTQPTRLTISFTVPSRLHLAIGAALAATTIALFWTHFALPADHGYKVTTGSIGNLAGCVTAVYMAWCTTQQNRSDIAELTDVTKAATEAAARRQEDLRSTIEAAATAILLSLRDITETLAEDRGNIKGIEDAIAEATGAVIALQDCYLADGKALVLPAQRENAPHEQS